MCLGRVHYDSRLASDAIIDTMLLTWQAQLQDKTMTDYRSDLLAMYKAGLSAVNGSACVSKYLSTHPIAGDVFIISIGKAAIDMAQGAISAIGEQLKAGLVITRSGHAGSNDSELIKSGFRIIEASHPVPDQSSIDAGQQLLDFIATIPDHTQVLFLLSGGTSSLVEVLPNGISLAQYSELVQWLLSQDMPIDVINNVRKRCSCIKAGRLARHLAKQTVTCLAISDVPGDDVTVIGSGLLVADAKLQSPLSFELPEKFMSMMNAAPGAPTRDEDCFASIQFHIVANIKMAMKAVHEKGQSLGYNTFLHEEFILFASDGQSL